MTGFLPPAEYYARLPKNIAGAGVVFHDDADRILLVRPYAGLNLSVVRSPHGGSSA